MKRPACAGRDDARSYSEGCQPSTLFPGTLELPLEETMRLVLNVIWLLFGGLWLALGYLLAALVCFLLIVTIPFGFAALRIASYALWPFGRTIIDKPGAGTGALIGNIIWLLLVRGLARDRAPGQRGGDGADDRRHTAGARQSQTDPGVPGAAGQGNRSRRPATPSPIGAAAPLTRACEPFLDGFSL